MSANPPHTLGAGRLARIGADSRQLNGADSRLPSLDTKFIILIKMLYFPRASRRAGVAVEDGTMAGTRLTAGQIASVNAALAQAPPETILRWAAETFGRKLTMATAFGPEGCCLIH